MPSAEGLIFENDNYGFGHTLVHSMLFSFDEKKVSLQRYALRGHSETMWNKFFDNCFSA